MRNWRTAANALPWISAHTFNRLVTQKNVAGGGVRPWHLNCYAWVHGMSHANSAGLTNTIRLSGINGIRVMAEQKTDKNEVRAMWIMVAVVVLIILAGMGWNMWTHPDW